MTLSEAFERLPSAAREGDRKNKKVVVEGKKRTMYFAFYDGEWKRWIGRDNSNRNIYVSQSQDT